MFCCYNVDNFCSPLWCLIKTEWAVLPSGWEITGDKLISDLAKALRIASDTKPVLTEIILGSSATSGTGKATACPPERKPLQPGGLPKDA